MPREILDAADIDFKEYDEYDKSCAFMKFLGNVGRHLMDKENEKALEYIISSIGDPGNHDLGNSSKVSLVDGADMITYYFLCGPGRVWWPDIRGHIKELWKGVNQFVKVDQLQKENPILALHVE